MYLACRHNILGTKYIGNPNTVKIITQYSRQLSGTAAWACLIYILMRLDTDTINTLGCDRKSTGNCPTLGPDSTTFSRIIHSHVLLN